MRDDRDPAGFDGDCPKCGTQMIQSTSGRGYCPECADVLAGGTPLVPITWSGDRFLNAQTKFNQAVRGLDEAILDAAGKGDDPTGLKTLIKLWDLVNWFENARKADNRPRGGRPPRLRYESDQKKLRRMVQTEFFPSLAALTRAFNAATGRVKKDDKVDRHTVQRFLEGNGLKLKQRSARRS